MAEIVYVLCALTCLACATLLARAYLRARMRILLWSTLCFALLTVNNAVLFLDLVIYKEINLLPIRDISAFLGLAVLVVGLIWDGD